MKHTSRSPRIFLAESDFLVANDLMCELENEGIVVAGVSSTLEGALKQITDDVFDFALLNIWLRDNNCYPAAKKLQHLKVPFAFFTGVSQAEIDAEFQAIPRIAKPQDCRFVARELKKMIASMVTPAVETG